jgi:hypothetical protein
MVIHDSIINIWLNIIEKVRWTKKHTWNFDKYVWTWTHYIEHTPENVWSMYHIDDLLAENDFNQS